MHEKNSIRVTGRPLREKRHICAFFHSKEEEYRTLLDFIKEGLEQREKAVHIVDAVTETAIERGCKKRALTFRPPSNQVNCTLRAGKTLT
jgi:hypothetical protein